MASTNMNTENLVRLVRVGNGSTRFCDNTIKTSKYEWWSFLAYNLFEQMKTTSNVYFFIIGLLQMIRAISPTDQYPLIYIPLVFVLTLNALRDAIEENKRKKKDKEINQRPTHLLSKREHSIETEQFQLRVGNVIKVTQNETFPADLVLLASSEHGSAYIETKDLDGESYFKRKEVPRGLREAHYNYTALMNKEAIFECEGPSKHMYHFSGLLTHGKDTIYFDNDNFLLSGASLKNTDWIVGLIVYTGHETKIMMNSRTSSLKMSSYDDKIQDYLMFNILMQVLICAFLATCFVMWLGNHPIYEIVDPTRHNKTLVNWFLNFMSWMLLMTSFIPISLLTSFQFVKYFQGYFLEKNPKFKTDAYSLKCQTSQLNEDLGLIEYVFSDKTGTLTKNNMVFKSMYTDGRRYGSLGAEPETTATKQERIVRSAKPRLPHQLGGQYPESSGDEELEGSDRSSLKKQSRAGISPDQALHVNQRYQELQGTDLDENTHKPLPTDVISAVKVGLNAGQFRNKLFFSILTCCHEVAVKQDSSTGEKVLNASSPDEVALLKFAAEVGYSIEGFDERTMEILVKEQDYQGNPSEDVQSIVQTTSTVKKYKLLAQFRFNSERSRMSVVVKDQEAQKYYLLCKGADHVMMERAASFEGFSKEELKGVLSDYSSRGLRTLVYGYKELSEEQVDTLIKNMKTVEQKVGKEKELRMAELANDTEQNLQILGASAVEDELQDDVRDTLRSLRSAGIKVWMLTGDKFETAVNIGYSSGLLKTDDKLIELKPEDEAIKEEELRRFFKELELAIQQNTKKTDGVENEEKAHVCVALGGASFRLLYNDKRYRTEFAKYIPDISVVVAARVTPGQKAEFVTLVEKSVPEAKTLAIGDGANDVNMICTAKVGVAIYGKEGLQASTASDYSIPEFKLLKPLLLHQGSEFCRINQNYIYYNFYKNFLVCMPQVFYGAWSGFSAINFLNPIMYQLYNVILTFWPILWYGLFDTNPRASRFYSNPKIYSSFHQSKPNALTFKKYLLFILAGVLISFITFFLTMHGLQTFGEHTTKGRMYDIFDFGTLIMLNIVAIAQFKVLELAERRSGMLIFWCVGSWISGFLVFLIEMNFTSNRNYNTIRRIFSDLNTYLLSVFILGATIFLEYMFNRL